MKFMGYVSIPVHGEEILTRADVEQFGISTPVIFPCFDQMVLWRSYRFIIVNGIGSCSDVVSFVVKYGRKLDTFLVNQCTAQPVNQPSTKMLWFWSISYVLEVGFRVAIRVIRCLKNWRE